MSDREHINTYLNTLGRYLARLPSEDATEVLREIESHIYDAIDMAEVKGETVDLLALLAGFGPPRVLAQKYTSHMLDGTPPPEGFSAITAVKHKVTKGLYWSTLIIGYGLAATLLLLAVLKVMFPADVGVCAAPGGESIVVGYSQKFSSHCDELMGWGFVPFCLIVGGLVARSTFSLSRILRRIAK